MVSFVYGYKFIVNLYNNSLYGLQVVFHSFSFQIDDKLTYYYLFRIYVSTVNAYIYSKYLLMNLRA